jgi:NADPH2:quinone reductase
MNAIRVKETGGPEVLQLEEIDPPEPGPGQVRVRVEAAGLNFIDVYHREGRYPMELPFTPGQEAAGVVDAVGPDVSSVSEGDRVAYALQPASYAQYVVVPADKVVTVPDGVDSQLAAAVMVTGMTAHYLTHSTVPLEEGMTVLVHAAAGGAGQLVVQVAKRRGARVLGTTSTDEKERLAREAGADEVIRYRNPGDDGGSAPDFLDEVRRLTDGRGVDVVYDSVGQATFRQSLESLRPRGYLVLFGGSSGAVPPFDPIDLMQASWYLTRPTLGHYMATRDELEWRAGDVLGWVASGELDVRIDRTWPLADAAEAHRYIEAGKTQGKVLLIP